MANLKQWMLDQAGGEEIEAIVLGPGGNQDIGPSGTVLSWDEALQFIDYEFNDNYNTNSSHAIYAWTPTKVIAIAKYDGQTWPFFIPRHPMNITPEKYGDG